MKEEVLRMKDLMDTENRKLVNSRQPDSEEASRDVRIKMQVIASELKLLEEKERNIK
jgi:hypothetical protein